MKAKAKCVICAEKPQFGPRPEGAYKADWCRACRIGWEDSPYSDPEVWAARRARLAERRRCVAAVERVLNAAEEVYFGTHNAILAAIRSGR